MTTCNCEYCIKCPTCGHKADEHMCGDFNAGICYVCQREGKECHEIKVPSPKPKPTEDLETTKWNN